MKLFSRVNNPYLFAKMQDLLPVRVEPLETFHGYEEAAYYLQHVLSQCRAGETIVNIDQDCFIFDWGVFIALCKHMTALGYNYAGVLDNVDIPGRDNISPVVMNPFFNVFRFNGDPLAGVELDLTRVEPTMNMKCILNLPDPPANEPRNEPFSEPFNAVFNYIFEQGYTPYYLDAYTDNNGATYLTFKGIPFAVHTWYSRDYGVTPEATKRIDLYYHEALMLKETCN